MTFTQRARGQLLLVALLAGVWFLVSAYLVVWQATWVDAVDLHVGEPVAAFTNRHPALEGSARVVAQLTRFWPMTLYATVAASWLALKGFRRPALWLLATLLTSGLAMWILKAVFDRDRPEYANMKLTDGAFPSGHATASATAAGVAIVLAAVFLRRRQHRRAVAATAVTFALVVGLNRLVLGVHGLLDVLAGYALAAVVVCVAAYLVDPTPRRTVLDPLPSPVPSTRRLAVVLNPSKVDDPDAFRAFVDFRARELGWSPPAWFETTVEDTGRSMAHEAALDGAELVVVCGGDGTVRTVCAELAGTGIPVGVIPAGTGNLLARNLALPLYLNAAIDVALAGQDRAIDIVRISGDGLGEDEHFLVMAGMGFDAAIMEGANDEIKAKVGWLAYVVSGLRNLMFPAVRVEVSVDDQPWTKHRARTIVVGNVGFLQAGLPLLPQATIDDGRIDVVLVNPRRFLSWLRVVARVLSRGRKVDETVMRMTGRTVAIRAAHDTPRQIDGDSIGPGKELACDCLAGRLLVRVPR